LFALERGGRVALSTSALHRAVRDERSRVERERRQFNPTVA
jgi:hypothetical protein